MMKKTSDPLVADVATLRVGPFTFMPPGFHVARVKFPRLSTVSPPNSAHQSPMAGSVCLMTGNGEADARMARPNNGTRSWVNTQKKLKDAQPLE